MKEISKHKELIPVNEGKKWWKQRGIWIFEG